MQLARLAAAHLLVCFRVAGAPQEDESKCAQVH